MKKITSLLILFVTLAISFNGCKKEKTTTPPVANPIIKLAPNTIWIDDPTSQTLIQVDSNKVVFNGNTSQLQNLKVGDIIVSGIAPNAPYGYLRKILGIQKNGNQYNLSTQEIPMTDAFEELHVKFEKTITGNDTVGGKKESLEFTVNFPNEVIYDADGNDNTTADQIRLDGSVSFTPYISADIDISSFQLTYAKINARFQTEMQNQITVGGSLASFSQEITIFQVPISTIQIPNTPIVIVPYLRVSIGANGSVNVEVSASYTNTSTIGAFIKYDNGAWSNGHDENMQNTYTFSGIQGTVDAKAYIEPGIDFTFWGSHWASGSIITQAYVKFHGQILPTQGCDLKAGLSAGIEANVQIFGLHFVSVSYPNIFDYSNTLFTCTGGNTQPPVADFSAFPTSINVGQSVSFTDLSANSPSSWQWTFTCGTPSSSTVQNPTGIVYNAAGTYNVALTATNANGNNTTTKTGYIIVSQTGSAPIADFAASLTQINTGQSIRFTDLSANTPTSWQWTFTGATPSSSTSQNPIGITYNTVGTYNVTLTATNANGSNSTIKSGYIIVTQSGSAPVANFSANPTSINVGQSVGFTDLSSNSPTSWQWTFTGATPSSSTSQSPTGIVYNSAGTYNVSLTATNNYGSDAEIKNSYITVTQSANACGGINTVTDIDGNIYNTVSIGNQCWMQENLKTTRYQDGSSILNCNDSLTWANIYNTSSQTPAWCYYGSNIANDAIYGKLYNWYAASDSRNVCPNGWHLPSDAEWHNLIFILDTNAIWTIGSESSTAGGKMKSMSLWNAPNTGANNSSGFTALPSGSRYHDGSSNFLGANGYFWHSTDSTSTRAFYTHLYDNRVSITRSFIHKVYGFSLRCIKD